MSGPEPGAPRVLIVDADASFRETARITLLELGCRVEVAADARAGLAKATAFDPTLLLLDLELPEDGGAWLVRRLRDDYIGTLPRLVIASRAQAVGAGIQDLGVDVVILKPVGPRLLAAAIKPAAIEPASAKEARSRELVKLSLLESDIELGCVEAARRLASGFRAREALAACLVGDRHFVGASGGPPEEDPRGAFWTRCRLSQDGGTSIWAQDDEGVPLATLAVPIVSPGGQRLGVLVLENDQPLVSEAAAELRGLATRLARELAWRTVHERIAADRDRLREIALLDPLVGVWTRAALDQHLGGEVASCVRRGEPLTGLVVDLRGLRAINEGYGHAVGDAVLRHVAQIARRSLRANDLVARHRGDQFALVLPGTPLAGARLVAERFAREVAESPHMVESDPILLSVAIGIAPLLADDAGAAMLGRAAAAARAAKKVPEGIAVADASTQLDERRDANTLEAGQTLGGMYQIIHEISRGAMGVVYRAEDLGLARPVALKTLRNDLTRDRGFVQRFRAEAATLAALRHENLVQVHAFGTDGDDVYFVMELVEGVSLDDHVARARAQARYVPLDEAKQILEETAAALDCLHRANVVHRDVKPANVLLDRVRARAVLVDVGIARRHDADAHFAAGTPGFTPPESFVGGEEGPTTDVYGLAAIAMVLLIGEPPFGEGEPGELLARQRHGEVRRARARRPGLPPEIDDLLGAALAADPKGRPKTPGGFVRTLATLLARAPEEVRLGLDRSDESGRLVAVPTPVSLGSTVPPPRAPSVTMPRGVKPPPMPPPIPAGARMRTATAPPASPYALTEHPEVTSPSVPIPHGLDDRPSGPQVPYATLREPEGPELAAPHTRGVLFRTVYRVLGARAAAPFVQKIAKQDPELSAALQPQATLLSWHPTDAFVRLIHEAERAGRDPWTFGQELARAATTATFSHFLGADPRAVRVGPVLLSMQFVWPRYHSWGVLETQTVGERSVDIAITGGPADARLCGSSAGIFEQVAVLSGASAARVDHLQCQGRGAGSCVFRVTWEGGA